MDRVRRGYDRLRDFLSEILPFVAAITAMSLLITLLLVLHSERQQTDWQKEQSQRALEEEEKQDELQRERLLKARDILREELIAHEEITQRRFEELVTALKALLDRPSIPGLIHVPVAARMMAPAKSVDSVVKRAVPKPSVKMATGFTAPPAVTTTAVCDKGNSCGKGKGKKK